MSRYLLSAFAAALFLAEPAMAYVGPGSGLGAIAVLFGLIGTVFLTLVSFIWYPIRRLYRKFARMMRVQKGARL